MQRGGSRGGEERRVLGEDLARRLHRALTASKEEIFTVIEDPSEEVLQALLKNPQLDENHLLALLKRRELREELLLSICRHSATEQSRRVKVALARHPSIPARILGSLLPHLYLFELVDLCLLTAVTPDQRLAAERLIIRRLPATPLGNKLTLARRGTATVVEALLAEGDHRVVDACLENPRMSEGSVFRFLNGRAATAETISAVARHGRWKNRPGVRMAVLVHPKTPEIWFHLFLPQLQAPQLRELLRRPLAEPRRELVRGELAKRGNG